MGKTKTASFGDVKTMSLGGAFARKAIACVTALALVVGLAPAVGLTPTQKAWAGGKGEGDIEYPIVAINAADNATYPLGYTNNILKKMTIDGKFVEPYDQNKYTAGYPQETFVSEEDESILDFVSNRPKDITIYVPCLKVWVPAANAMYYDQGAYKSAAGKGKLGSDSTFAGGVDFNSGTEYFQIKDVYQKPAKAQIQNQTIKDAEGNVINDMANPMSLRVWDETPNDPNFELAFDINYNSVYGADLVASLDAMLTGAQKENPDEFDKALKAFDYAFPAVAQDLSSFNIEGDLDPVILKELPFLLEYLKSPEAKNFEDVSIKSTEPITNDVLDTWKKLTPKQKEALGDLNIKLDLPKDKNSDEFAKIIASYAKTVELGKEAVSTVKNVNSAVKTIYVQQGKTVKLPYVAYAADKKATGAVKVDWTATKADVASVVLNTKSGSVMSKKLNAKSTLTVQTAGWKKGTSKIKITASGKSMTYTIKVIKKAKVVKKFTAKVAKSIKAGKTANIKISKITKNGSPCIASFKVAKKYSKYVAVDAAGQVTAKKAYKKGKKAIPITVKVGKKSKTVKVKIK